MFASTLARVLMGLGVGVGLMTAGVMALELQVNLPDWMIRVAMIKLAFIAAGGLLAGGALLGRHARSRVPSGDTPQQIGEAAAEPVARPELVSALPIKRSSNTPE